jgi:predicted nucleic acid-binding protein
VFIVSFKGADFDIRAQSAYNLLQDSSRLLLFSDYVWLEVMPMRLNFKQEKQMRFIKKLFDRSEKIHSSQTVIDKAISLATSYGLNAMDALHVATAIEGKADEFVTFEKPTEPFFRIPSSEIRIVSLDLSIIGSPSISSESEC